MNKDFKQTSRAGSLAWLLQRISAVILFILLLLHFVTYHFLGKGKAVDYHWVVSKAGSWWFLWGVILFHAFNGVRIVIVDFFKGSLAHKKLFIVLIAAAFVLWAAGSYLILSHVF